MHHTHTGLTLRLDLSAMKGQAGEKGNRTAVCIGHTARGWAFVPTTSSWMADWQRNIRQTGKGWRGHDLRYRKPTAWTPNMVMFLSDEEITAAVEADPRIGRAPEDVVDHARQELAHTVRAGLMHKRSWFSQPGLCRR